MTDTIAWKISLPSAAPRQGTEPSPGPSAEMSPDRIKAEGELLPWLTAADLAGMKDRDVEVLAAESSALARTSSRDAALWKSFPEVKDIARGENLASLFKASVDLEKADGALSRSICDRLGFGWDSPAAANVEEAERTAVRYSAASEELSRLAVSTHDWLEVRPTLKDASFLLAISSSLRAADFAAMADYEGSMPEIDQAVGVIEEIDRISADLIADFSFDPGQHSLHAFGGVIRAFSSGRAQDFLTAARKLGISPKGPEKAQRAAALLRSYVNAVSDLSGSPAGTDAAHATAILAKARLSLSIRRRCEVLAIDRDRIPAALRHIETRNMSLYPGHDGLAVNADTKKLIEDNSTSAPEGALVSDLAAELDRQASAIRDWIARQRRGLMLAQSGSTHADIEEILLKNPLPVTDESGWTVICGSDLEALERHLQWLHDASLLPLSDELLSRYLEKVAAEAA
jgi:hypothetical protein